MRRFSSLPGLAEPTFDQYPTLVREPKPVEVWTPRVIGWTSALLGFPGGLLLLCVNRRRMRFRREGRNLLILGTAGFFAYSFAAFLAPDSIVEFFAPLINATVAYYLYKLADSDRLRFDQANSGLGTANWLAGALLGLGGTLLFLVVSVALAILVFALAFVMGVPLPR